jgi:hypothetical protein
MHQPDAAPVTMADTEGLWTTPRIELKAWLYRHAPGLSTLYAGAVQLIFGPPVPGRIRFIAHAIREVCNRLPDAVCGVETEHLDYATRMDEIARAWERSGLRLDASDYAGETPGPEGPRRVPVDAVLFAKLFALVGDHARGRKRPQENAARLFEAVSPENHALREMLAPVIRQWVGIGRWSVGKAHDWKLLDEEYPEQDLRRKFELFETTLMALARGFFEAVDELDEILEETNS